MKKTKIMIMTMVFVFVAGAACADWLDDPYSSDPYNQGSRFRNNDPFAPWNDMIMRSDPYAPWNDMIMQSDPFAPWNDPLSDQHDTNKYLREEGVRDSEYYWK